MSPHDTAEDEGTGAMNPQMLVSKADLAAFCHKHGIKRFSIYGSTLREDFGPESDIDVLVEFEPDRIPGLFGIAGMELELSDLFSGHKGICEHPRT